MIEHREIHKIGKNGPIPLEEGQVLIETAFDKTRPQVTFNPDLFRDLLERTAGDGRGRQGTVGDGRGTVLHSDVWAKF